MTAAPFERLSTALSGRYRLEREVGAGGMATVYLAEDVRHHRRVAIKVLKPELSEALGAERFLKEIAVTANLQHTHILPLFDSGEVPQTPEGSQASYLYYVMPYIEGESLRQRIDREKQLPLDTAIDLTRQLAGALDYAHCQGVVHRDIKPENILIKNGQALLTDFGIALAISQAGGSRLTQTGLSIGSPHYMSPEQATGERDIDARSDVYSLGCVLYEMIAGDPPFGGSTAQAIVARKLTGRVPSLRPIRDTVSKCLDDVIAKALAKVPADRYPSMALFTDAIARCAGDQKAAPVRRHSKMRIAGAALGAVAVAGVMWLVSSGTVTSWFTPPPRFARVAVLPLENRTGDSTQNYVVDGLTESVIADLARLEGVDVISLSSVLGYRTAPKPVDSIARDLDVQAVVSGSVQRRDDRLLVELRLIAPGAAASSADTLESPAGQVAELEQRIVRTLTREIGGRLAEPRAAPSVGGSPNAEVQQLHLRARYHLASRTPEGLQNALDYFRQVLAIDPAHAPAHAGLAQYYSLLPFYTNTPPSEAFARAKSSATKALELDQYLPEAHGALAYVLAYGDWNWTDAELAYRRAIALQPSGADLHHALSRLLASRGRMEEAVAAAERAHRLDPLSLVAHANVGVIRYFGRDYAEARRRLVATLELDPNFSTAHWGLGLVHQQLGEPAQAIAAFEKAIAISGRGRNTLASLGHLLASGGRRTEAEAILNELTRRGRGGPIQPYMLALVLAGLGRNDEALTMLERSYDERSALLSYLGRDPRFDSLRSAARFTALLRRMNLAPNASQ
ncbi:MAG: protein kinase domain-containing protein [Gemmatimonadaceae bacterium]